MAEWSEFDKFEELIDKYLPEYGDGTNMATQCVTAVNRIIYKWFNDGDVYDNHYALDGWCNDVSGSANWLVQNCDAEMLYKISNISTEEEYTDILLELAEACLNEEVLSEYAKMPKVGSAYQCDGFFSFENFGNGEEDGDSE